MVLATSTGTSSSYLFDFFSYDNVSSSNRKPFYQLRFPQIMQPLRKASKVNHFFSLISVPGCVLLLLTRNRNSKLVTTIVSTFTAYYIHSWGTFFPEMALTAPLPSFDGRAVQYPSIQNLRDYLSWRQVDCELSILPVYMPVHMDI